MLEKSQPTLKEPKSVVSSAEAISVRVKGILSGVDPSILDTPQVVGDYRVTVTETVAGEKGEVRKKAVVEKDERPVAEYSRVTGADGRIIIVTTKLHGEVDGARVTVTLTKPFGLAERVSVSVPNPQDVLPGSRHSKPLKDHKPGYLKKVGAALQIPL